MSQALFRLHRRVFNATQIAKDCFCVTSLCIPDIKEGWCGGDDWAGGVASARVGGVSSSGGRG